jgi:hypothetical protein
MAARKLKKSELLNILSKDWDARRAKVAKQRAKQNKWTLEWKTREKNLSEFLNKVGNAELTTLIKRQPHFVKLSLGKEREKNKNQVSTKVNT